jgi:hypothetical protein
MTRRVPTYPVNKLGLDVPTYPVMSSFSLDLVTFAVNGDPQDQLIQPTQRPFPTPNQIPNHPIIT